MNIRPRSYLFWLVFSLIALLNRAHSGEVAVYIISPASGEIVTSPFQVKFGLRGMGVAPAGVAKNNTGHHHLLIDVKQLPDLDKPVPADANHRHFGGGQTETMLELLPGVHTLQLLLGDQLHVPHNPPLVSEKISIRVE